jgi:pyruvate kinase
LPSISAKDLKDIEFAIEQKVEFVTVSCLRSTADVMELRKLLGISKIRLLSKIENQAGLEQFHSILKISDGIIIDRGYLGVEIDIASVGLKQKELIKSCNLAGKPVLISNQLLESISDRGKPTRSETSDITSLLMEGVDGLILSSETAKGKLRD